MAKKYHNTGIKVVDLDHLLFCLKTYHAVYYKAENKAIRLVPEGFVLSMRLQAILDAVEAHRLTVATYIEHVELFVRNGQIIRRTGAASCQK